MADGYVAIVTSCEKNKKLYPQIKERFDKLNIPYYVLYGNPKLYYSFPNYSLPGIYNLEDNHILKINVCDGYESLIFKIVSALKYVKTHHPNSFVLKTDDDVEFVDYPSIIRYMNIMKSHDYGGHYSCKDVNRQYHFGKCKLEKWNTTLYQGRVICGWCSGGFYILSPKARDAIIDFYDNPVNGNFILHEIYEDKFIGDTLYKAGIKPISLAVKEDGSVKW